MSEKEKELRRTPSPVNGQVLPRGRPFTSETAREAGKKGGRKAGINIKARKTLREELLNVLTEMLIPEKGSGKNVPVQEALSVSLIRAALSGNVRAFEIIRDTIGEKPIENVTLVTSNFSALDDAFKTLQSASERGSSE